MKNRERRNYLLLYSILFLVMAGIVFSVFLIRGKTFIWNRDGFRQHYKALVFYSKWLKEIVRSIIRDHRWYVPMYSFNIGYGADILMTLHPHGIGDPLALFSLLIPTRYMVHFYDFLVVFRLYLAGVSFLQYVCYCRHIRPMAAVAGAFTYIFCSFAFRDALWHPIFMNPMICLPLVLLGVEKLKKERKPAVFILSVCLSAVCNFFFFYQIALLTMLYVVFRVFMWYGPNSDAASRESKEPAAVNGAEYNKGRVKEAIAFVLKLTGYALIGTAMSAVILLPVLNQALQSTRLTVDSQIHLSYPVSYLISFFGSFITWHSPGYGTYMGFPSICIIALILLGINRKKYRALANAYVLLTIFLLIPYVAHVLNAFSYAHNRWCFAYALLTAYVLCTVWEDMMFLSVKYKKKIIFCAVLYVVLSLYTQQDVILNKCAALGILAVILVLLLYQPLRRLLSPKRREAVVFLLVLVNICLTPMFMYFYHADSEDGYIAEFCTLEEAEEYISKTDKEILDIGDEAEFYRYTGSNVTLNSTLLSGLFGLQSHWTLTNGCVSEFYSEMALCNNSTSYTLKDLDNRTILNTLAGVKYFVARNKKSVLRTIPYGYELCDGQSQKDDYLVYENQYALPFGYTYKNYLTMDQFDQYSPMEKQESLVYGAAIEADMEQTGYEQADIVFSAEQADYKVTCEDGSVNYLDHAFVAGRDGSSVVLDFTGSPDTETYLYVKGLFYEQTEGVRLGGPETLEITVAAEDTKGKTVSDRIHYHPKDGRYYNGRHDFLMNLYYGKRAKNSVTITFPKAGIYSFETLEIWLLPVGDLAERMQMLAAEKLENLDMHINNAFATERVTGEITLKEPGILCLAMPYQKGWTAYVDGKQEELFAANINSSALLLDAGTHKIELVYKTPGIRTGLYLTLAGCILAVVLTVSHAIPQRQKI